MVIGKAICYFGEAIAYLHYNVSSGPSFISSAPFLSKLRLVKSCWWKMVRLLAVLVRLLHICIITSALVLFESFFCDLEVRKVRGGKW